MAYSDSFPAVRPVFQSDFANGGRIDPRISYSRSTTGTYFGTDKHLSSENLITHSNGFTGTATVRVVNTTGQSDPAGGTDAVQMSQQAGQTVAGGVYWAYTLEVGQEYTWSVYVKNDGRTFPQLAENFGSGGALRRTWFDTSSTGAAATTDAGHTALITKLGDWFRITIRFTPIVATGNVYFYISSADNSSVVADDGNGFIAYSASLSTTGQLVHENTSGQIARSYAPTLQTAAINAPRFEYSASDSASMGLLVESQFEQHMLRSEELDNASWTVSNGTVQANAGVAPDGTLSADLLVEAAETSPTTNTHNVRQQPLASVSASTSYTSTIFAKAAGRSHAMIYTNIGGANTYGIFSLSDGSVTTTSGGGSFSSTSCGNGWYRLQMTFTTSNTNNGPVYFYTCEDGSTFTYTGNGYGSVLLWGANLTQSSHAYSYLKAEGSATTKAADSASITSSSLFDNGQGAVVVDASASGYNFGRFFALSDGGSNDNSIQMFAQSTTQVASDWRVGGTTVRQMSKSGLPTLSGGNKAAVSWETNQLRQAFNGTETNTYTTYPAAPLTKLDIGCWGSGNQANGHCKRIAVYGEPLSQTELESLTS